MLRDKKGHENDFYIMRITETAKAHRFHNLCAYALFQEDELY